MKRLWTTLLVALLVGVWSSAALAESLTPLDVARLNSVGWAEISPDGKRIAYLAMEARDPSVKGFENGSARRVLRLYSIAEGTDRVFIGWDEKMRSPRWTADSRHLTFLSQRDKDEKTSLYRISADGGEASRVLTFRESIASYSVAPDGRRVAFVARDAKPASQKKAKDLGFDAEIFEEDWLTSRVYVTTLGADTSELEALPLEGHASEVHWSPQAGSDRLLVVLAPNPGMDASLIYRRAHVVNTAGEVLASLNNPGKLGQVAWSPDGARVAMTAGTDIHDPDDGALLVTSASGGELRDLTRGMAARVDDFAWRNGRELVAAVSVGASSELMAMPADGGQAKSLSDRSRNLRGVSVSRDGRMALVADTPSHPAELFYGTERLTDSNPWLAQRRLAKQELVTYRARDGREIEGMLLRPRDGQAPAPLIVVVHGGPESHYDNGWLTAYKLPGQVGAALGYAVFYPNYRGSTGYGQEFGRSSQGDPAGAEFDDVLDGIDYLIEQGVADPKRVGVTGGSYGGYATAWMSTRYSDRIAAGVMFVGVSDKISMMGTTDVADELYLMHFRKHPWEDYQFYLERSPINYVTQARTPLLILHGKDDPRVHPTQSMELYRYLQIVGETPVRLVLYPGEGHGNAKAAARYDYNLRMLRWFDHYLRGPGGEKPEPHLQYDLPTLDQTSRASD